MAQRPKRPRDANQLAKLIGDIAIGEVPNDSPRPGSPESEARRKGGLKGGKARARTLSGRQREKMAKKAARARWAEHLTGAAAPTHR